MRKHALQSAPEAPVSAVRAKRLPRTMAAHRVEAQLEAGELLERAMRAAEVSDPHVAGALDCDASHVRHLRQGESTLAVRDLLALREKLPRLYRAFADEVLALAPGARVAKLDPQLHMALISAELGDVGRALALALADGRIDEQERDSLRRELFQLIEAARRFSADLG